MAVQPETLVGIQRSFRLLTKDGSRLVANELGRILRSLNTHFTHLSTVELDLRREARGDVVFHGLDFSDIYTFMHPFQRNTRHSRLVSIETEALQNLILLPGALAELIAFLRTYVALQPRANDTSYLRKITTDPRAHRFLAAYDERPQSDNTSTAARALFEGFPLAHVITDGKYAEATLGRLKAILGRLVPFDAHWGSFDSIIDYEVYAQAWQNLTRLRPGRPILSNKVDALNYGLAAGVSKQSSEQYLALVTCSERPHRAFRSIQWDDDPLRDEPHLLKETYNFSFVRSPADATYRALIESHAMKHSKTPLEFAAQVRLEVQKLHAKLTSEFPVFERLLSKPLEPGKSEMAVGKVARVGANLVTEILTLQEKYFHDFLDQIAIELDRDAIADANQEIYDDLYELLGKPEQFVDSVRFSYARLTEAYRDMTQDLRSIAPEMIAELERERLVDVPDSANAFSVSVERDPDSDFEFAFMDGTSELLLRLECFDDCFSVYWPAGVDSLAFLRAVKEVTQLVSVEEVTSRIPEFQGKRFKAPEIILKTKKNEYVRTSWDLNHSLAQTLERGIGGRDAGSSESFCSIRINTPYFDIWCDLQVEQGLNPYCGLMSHWECTSVILYLLSQTGLRYASQAELQSELRTRLKRYPGLKRGRHDF